MLAASLVAPSAGEGHHLERGTQAGVTKRGYGARPYRLRKASFGIRARLQRADHPDREVLGLQAAEKVWFESGHAVRGCEKLSLYQGTTLVVVFQHMRYTSFSGHPSHRAAVCRVRESGKRKQALLESNLPGILDRLIVPRSTGASGEEVPVVACHSIGG